MLQKIFVESKGFVIKRIGIDYISTIDKIGIPFTKYAENKVTSLPMLLFLLLEYIFPQIFQLNLMHTCTLNVSQIMRT